MTLPDLTGLLAAGIAAGFGSGLVLLAIYLHGVTPDPSRPPGRVGQLARRARSARVGGRSAAAVVLAVLVLVLTHWLVAAVGIAALAVFWPTLFGGAGLERRQIVQLDALVMWTESLRDTVAARNSLEQAIPATTVHAPEPIRPALIRLAGLLRARVPLEQALRELSRDLADASADKVIGALILNTRNRGTRLADVLTALAFSARQDLDQRRRVSAGRASIRRSVQLVVIITLGFGLFLALFSRPYVAPYGTVGGQLMLAVVVGLFAAGFGWMRRLAGGEAVAPFLNRPGGPRPDAERQLVAYVTGSAGQAGPSGRRTRTDNGRSS